LYANLTAAGYVRKKRLVDEVNAADTTTAAGRLWSLPWSKS